MNFNRSAIRGVTAVVALVIAAGSAGAADLGGAYGGSLKDGPFAPFSWSGPYIGIQAGYAWDRGSDVSWGGLNSALTQNDGPLKYDSFVGGVHLGYNVQNGRIVWGIEGDVEYAPGEGDDEDRGGHTNGIDTKVMASLRGRLGLAFDKSLLYLTGGVAYMSADAVVRDIPSQPDISTSFTGWTIGGGVEHALTNAVSVRLEYRYTDFGLETENYTAPATGYTLGFEPELHAVRAGLSTKF